VGHVGGDDFILLYQSADWQQQCQNIVSKFAVSAVELFDPPARLAGGIHAEDRHGVTRFFPMTTLSIGAVRVQSGDYVNAEQVASVAARAKHDAKTSGEGLVVRQKSDFSIHI
jgi:GGDEF domain-containing protein